MHIFAFKRNIDDFVEFIFTFEAANMAATTNQEAKELQRVREAFASIRRRAKALGIGDNVLTKSPSLKVLRSKKFSSLVLFGIVLTVFAVLIGAGTILFRRKVITHRMVYSFLADKVFDFDLEKESCFYPYPEIILDIFRPPVNCSICRDVHGVEKLSNLTQEEFSRKYAYTSRPVVITDGTKGWTAEKAFSFDYFKRVYDPNSPALDSQDSNCQFFPYKTNFRTLKEVFNMSEIDAKMKGKPWYIGWLVYLIILFKNWEKIVAFSNLNLIARIIPIFCLCSTVYIIIKSCSLNLTYEFSH